MSLAPTPPPNLLTAPHLSRILSRCPLSREASKPRFGGRLLLQYEHIPPPFTVFDQSPDPPVKREFTCFSRLPVEMRLKIWKHVCFQPRCIDIWERRYGGLMVSSGTRIHNFRACRYVTHSHPPAILQTSREARQAGLTHYELGFGVDKDLEHGVRFTAPPGIYVNWDSDVICPSPPDFALPENFYDAPRPCRIAVEQSFELRAPHFWPGANVKEIILYDLGGMRELLNYREVDGLGEEFELDLIVKDGRNVYDFEGDAFLVAQDNLNTYDDLGRAHLVWKNCGGKGFSREFMEDFREDWDEDMRSPNPKFKSFNPDKYKLKYMPEISPAYITINGVKMS